MLTYESRLAFNLALILPGLLIIGLRLWVRNRFRPAKPPLTWILSDVFLVIEWCIAACVVGVDIYILLRRMELRTTRKTDPVSAVHEAEEIMVAFLKGSLFDQYAYVTCLWLLKASFLMSYYTMSPHLSTKIRRSLNLTWMTLAVTLLVLILAFTFWCWPIQRNWSLGPDFCSPQAHLGQAILVYVLHIGTDIPVMTIPFFIIRTLRIGRGERYAIAFMFMLGFMTAVCSTFSFILHLQFIQLDHDPNASLLSVQEKLEGIYLSACAEVCGAVFIVCLPSIRTAFRWFRNRFFGREDGSEEETYRTNEDGDIELSSSKVGFYPSHPVSEDLYINRKMSIERFPGARPFSP